MSKTRNPDALIRIGDAINVLCCKRCYPGPLCPDSYCVEMWDEFEDVERVDAVPVVRCRDCKWWRDTDHTCHEHSLVSPMTADEFCSRGERKDGDNHD